MLRILWINKLILNASPWWRIVFFSLVKAIRLRSQHFCEVVSQAMGSLVPF